jgi:hypothetical protein
MIDPIGSAPSVIGVYGSGSPMSIEAAQRVLDNEATETREEAKAPLPASLGASIDIIA